MPVRNHRLRARRVLAEIAGILMGFPSIRGALDFGVRRCIALRNRASSRAAQMRAGLLHDLRLMTARDVAISREASAGQANPIQAVTTSPKDLAGRTLLMSNAESVGSGEDDFTIRMAGGGVKPGFSRGATDDL